MMTEMMKARKKATHKAAVLEARHNRATQEALAFLAMGIGEFLTARHAHMATSPRVLGQVALTQVGRHVVAIDVSQGIEQIAYEALQAVL